MFGHIGLAASTINELNSVLPFSALGYRRSCLMTLVKANKKQVYPSCPRSIVSSCLRHLQELNITNSGFHIPRVTMGSTFLVTSNTASPVIRASRD